MKWVPNVNLFLDEPIYIINLVQEVISSVPENPEVLWRGEKEWVGRTLVLPSALTLLQHFLLIHFIGWSSKYEFVWQKDPAFKKLKTTDLKSISDSVNSPVPITPQPFSQAMQVECLFKLRGRLLPSLRWWLSCPTSHGMPCCGAEAPLGEKGRGIEKRYPKLLCSQSAKFPVHLSPCDLLFMSSARVGGGRTVTQPPSW